MKKRIHAVWTILLVIFFFYLLYQSTFAWNEEVTAPETTTTQLPENKTAFIVIKDTHYGVRRSGISSVQKSLELWKFDEKNEQVLLKHKNLLPTEKTQMMVLYDRGYDSFAHHSDVLSLVNFPYEHFYNGEEIFEVHGVKKDGEVYLTYKNKRIHLAPGESYHTVSSEGYKVTWTTIENYGLYDKSQFDIKGKKVKDKHGEVIPQEVDLGSLETKKLEPTEKKEYDTKPLVNVTN
ncbi:hypothetical protein [Bacillus thuringiensis]|uniref:hypothetical protein n=1 Tax=Bacillus thuringiensis TaxID=1428 RepID=UPI0021D69962|nr:hypothetical protein [Bacillus thuringiensis]MCU7666921.1 hypothetical protein [Bacillus thuringiensis]